MSKQDEFMKVQTCVLSVNIHCDGCEQKVRKILKKFEGVYSSSINAEQGRVTVSGCFDPQKLIKKLEKSGKHAELLGSQKGPSNNQVQVSDGYKGHNNKAQKGFGKEQPKSGHQHQQVLQQQVMKNNKEQKSVKFSKADPEEFDMSDEYDDDEDFYDDDDFSDEDEEFGHSHKLPTNKGGMPNKMMMQGNGNYGGKMGGGNGPTKSMIDVHGTNDKNGFKKGGGGVIEFPLEGKGKKEGGAGTGKGKKGKGEAEWKNSPKKNNGEKAGVVKKKKSGGGLRALLGFGNKKSAKVGGSVPKKPTSSSNNNNGNGKKDKKNTTSSKGNNKNEFQLDFTTGKSREPKSGGKGEKMGPGPGPGPMGNGMQFGQMGPGPMGNYPMGGHAAVRGLPAQPMMSGGGGYYQGMGQIPGYGGGPGNPYAQHQQLQQQQQQQQQYMAMMMNQHRGSNGNDMFQPMMYSRPHHAVNYAPPMGMAHPANDNLTHFFSDENTESCNIM